MGRVSDPESGIWGQWDMGTVGYGGESSLEPRTSSLNIQSVKSVKSPTLRVAELHSSLY